MFVEGGGGERLAALYALDTLLVVRPPVHDHHDKHDRRDHEIDQHHDHSDHDDRHGHHYDDEQDQPVRGHDGLRRIDRDLATGALGSCWRS